MRTEPLLALRHRRERRTAIERQLRMRHAAIALQAARRGRAGREKAEHRAAAARLAPPPLPWADPEGDSAVALQAVTRGRLSRSKSSRENAVRPESAPAGGGADAVDPGPVAAEA